MSLSRGFLHICEVKMEEKMKNDLSKELKIRRNLGS
jgi:hypothetical protein